MDIKWAAEQMRQGKKVRRTSWLEVNYSLSLIAVPAEKVFEIDLYGKGQDCVVNSEHNSLEIYFSTEALLADDWEEVKD